MLMNKKELRQQLLVEAIHTQEYINISEILKYLKSKGIESTVRTIQRDITELAPLIEVHGNWKNTTYSIPPRQSIRLPIPIENYFNAPYESRKIFKQFNFEIFDRLAWDIFSPEEKQELERLQTQFVRNISTYDSQTIINKEYQRIMIEFSWKSSAIEWNTYSLLSTEALITENIADTTKTKEETQMILNHKDAFNETIQNRQRFHTLKIGDIEYIHTVLTKWLWVQSNIRKSWVWITGTNYRPLSNEFQIQEALKKMVQLINSKEDIFEKTFLALLLLAYIQAFEDGNKRTSRMISNALLLAYGSIPLSYRIVDVVEYKKACILLYEQNNITYFKKLYIEQIQDAVSHYFTP